jgi:hypothetical protein
MIPCRIIHNKLPDAVLQQVLRVDEAGAGDPRWQLLRSGNTRRTYKFSPSAEEPAWVVKWGCRYSSLKQVRNAILGRDLATVEWQKTEEAARRGIPVVRFSLVAAPRLSSGRIQSLLVCPFLENSRNFLEALTDHRQEPKILHELLTGLGLRIAGVHQKNLLHQDFSLDNILVTDHGNTPEIIIIDWFKALPGHARGRKGFRTDMAAPLSDMIYAGLTPEEMKIFLRAYAGLMPWCRDRFEELIDWATKIRVRVCRRAYRNCTRRSRRLVIEKTAGYRLFRFKDFAFDAAQELLEGKPDRITKAQEAFIPWFSKSHEPALLQHWRWANQLHMTGLQIHTLGALAIGENLKGKKLILLQNRLALSKAQPLVESLRGPEQCALLRQAGDYMRRLHLLDISIDRLSLPEWYCIPGPDGKTTFKTTDLGCFKVLEESSVHARFGWIADSGLAYLGRRGLRCFLQGYCRGHEAGEIRRLLLEYLARGSQKGSKENSLAGAR